MKIKTLGEVVWKYLNNGRPKSTAQTLSQIDIQQYCLMAFSELMKQAHQDARKMGEDDEYYFYSGDLLTKEFPLKDPDARGYRLADMSSVEVFRLPKNAHIRNVYAVGDNKCDCSNEEIVQVAPGEESYYVGGEFSGFKYFVITGKGLLTRNIPLCAKKISVDSIYNDPAMDISYDMAFNIANAVLGVSLKIKGFPIKANDNTYNPQADELQSRLKEAV